MDMMMALRAHTRGGPEQLVYEQAPVPVPQPGEVLATVHAAAITFAELAWDLSWTTRDGRDRTPVIPSHEMRARAHQVHAMFFVVAPDSGVQAQLAGRVDQGRLRPVVSQTFPLGEGRRAFESGGRPRPPGKTVLAVR